MASPAFAINGGSVNVKASVAASGAVTAILDSTDGVRLVEWSITRTDEGTVPASYALVQSGSVGQQVDTTALAAGTAAVLRCKINGGLTNDEVDPATIQEVKFFVPLANGLEVMTAGETDSSGVNPERTSSATHGAVDPLNAAIRAADAAGSPQAAIDHKDSVRAATDAPLDTNTQVGLTLVATANGVMSNVDAIALNEGDDFLVKNEVSGSKNGIYTLTQQGIVSVQPWIATRRSDADTDALMTPGHEVRIEEGTANGGSKFFCSNTGAITLGTTALTYANATTAPTDIIIPDADGSAFRVRLAGAATGDEWVRITTQGGAEEMVLGTGDSGSRSNIRMQIGDNSSGWVVEDRDDGQNYLRLSSGTNGAFIFGEDGNKEPTFEFNIRQSNATAFVIQESGRVWFEVDTAGTPEITLGNTTDNPAITAPGSGLVTFGGPVTLPSFTVAGAPGTATAGAMIYVTDEVGGAIPAFGDGTNWRRVTDRAIIST